MNTEMEVRGIGQGALSVDEIKARVHAIEECYRSIMKKNVHYGVIPGTQKDTLLKPGAEKLLTMFQLATDPIVEDLSGDGFVKYRVTVRVTHSPTGTFVGTGIGECSSDEEKYRWRYAINDAEWDETPDHLRREKWRKAKRNKPAHKIRQIKTEAADIGNTIVKMAKKRAMVDAALTVTGASDMFDQDLDDMPDGFSPTEGGSDAAPASPSRKSERADSGSSAPAKGQSGVSGGRTITDPQRGRLLAIARDKGWDEEQVKQMVSTAYQRESLNDIRMGEEYDSIVREVETFKPDGQPQS